MGNKSGKNFFAHYYLITAQANLPAKPRSLGLLRLGIAVHNHHGAFILL